MRGVTPYTEESWKRTNGDQIRNMTDEALAEAMPEATVITVAQRVSSVKGCDLILVIEEGEIIGCGKHEELMATCAPYRQLSDSQMGGALLD